jgi:hypothetical protein
VAREQRDQQQTDKPISTMPMTPLKPRAELNPLMIGEP